MAAHEQRHIVRFRTTPRRSDFYSAISVSGFDVTAGWEESGSEWGYSVRPSGRVSDALGTSQEILFWFIDQQGAPRRSSLDRMVDIIHSEPGRFCQDFVVLVAQTFDQDELDACAQARGISVIIGVSRREYDTLPLRRRTLLTEVQGKLFVRDLYGVSVALTAPSAFFGRRTLINEITDVLRKGSSHIGLFGLRRMGKTSTLYRVIEALRRRNTNIVCHVDLEKVAGVGPSLEYFLWSLGESIVDGNKRIRKLPGYHLFGAPDCWERLRSPYVAGMFEADIRTVLRADSSHKIVFALDEVERMLEPGWRDGFVRSWRILRGIAQEHRGRISFLLTGTNPRCVELDTVDGVDNPIYNYFDKRYLRPFDPVESAELISTIGIRMGLRWTDQAVARAIRLVGGHPFLLRAFASRVHSALLPRPSVATVDLERVQALVEPFLSEYSGALSQMLDILRSEYGDEYFVLQRLALGNVSEYREYAIAMPDVVAHLRGYGLVREEQNRVAVQGELLQTWIQRRARPAVDAGPSPSGRHRYSQGVTFENYEIMEAVGRPGGFGEVYRVRRTTGRTQDECALKIFRATNYSALAREVEALSSSSSRHRGIVRFLDHGMSNSGEPYVVMEYLDGVTMRHYCEVSNRLSPRDATRLLSDILEALAALHPDDEKVAAIRARGAEGALEPGDLEQLSTARHGYVHRDIKPENVIHVADRGAVLIDFNISVRAGAPVKTSTSTPGYLPPDHTGGHWDADIDLYQVGMTVAQCAVGVEFDGDNLSDIYREAARLPAPLGPTLARLFAPTKEHRFSSARAALRVLSTPVR